MAACLDNEILELDVATTERWRYLFQMAVPYLSILEFRQSLNRPTVSDAHWDEVRFKQETLGHDCESYTYSLSVPAAKPTSRRKSRDATGTYLLKLMPVCPPISSASAVQQIAGLSTIPTVETDEEDAEAQFVRLSADAKIAIEDVLMSDYPQVQATFVWLTLPASKELDPVSRYPSLGIDTTLPQYRASAIVQREDLLQQEDYPVLYFFYGTLADPNVLLQKLNFRPDTETIHQPAHISKARLTTWGGKYNALVNGDGMVLVSAFVVESRDQEDALRVYETDRYEVVRCDIVMDFGVEQALTFRFVG